MDVLLYTNVLIDFLDSRAPFAEAADRVFQECRDGRVNGYFAAHSIPDIFYIFRKDYSAAARKDMLLGLFDVLEVVGIDRDKLMAALTSEDFADIEDCLQAECAAAVAADYIITRNLDDFMNSSIPALLPEAFLKKVAGDY
jgi:predicted nucleic acid-binding protein